MSSLSSHHPWVSSSACPPLPGPASKAGFSCPTVPLPVLPPSYACAHFHVHLPSPLAFPLSLPPRCNPSEPSPILQRAFCHSPRLPDFFLSLSSLPQLPPFPPFHSSLALNVAASVSSQENPILLFPSDSSPPGITLDLPCPCALSTCYSAQNAAPFSSTLPFLGL